MKYVRYDKKKSYSPLFTLLDIVNKIITRYGFKVNLDGYSETLKSYSVIESYNPYSQNRLSIEFLLWRNHFSEIQSLLLFVVEEEILKKETFESENKSEYSQDEWKEINDAIEDLKQNIKILKSYLKVLKANERFTMVTHIKCSRNMLANKVVKTINKKEVILS